MAQMGSQEPTMSSKQIEFLLAKADGTGPRHDNVKRTMETLRNKGLIKLTQSEEVNHKNQRIEVYHVNERDSYVVVAQLSPEFTARLVDEWRKLKQQSQDPVMQMAIGLQAAQQIIANKDTQIAQQRSRE